MKNKTDLPKAGAIAIAGIWVMATIASVLSASHGSGYDVLDKIADFTSVGVRLEEKISDRIDASTSDMTYYLKRLDTLMCDYRVEKLCNESVVKSYPEDVLTYDVQQEFVKTMNLAGANSMEDDVFEDYVKKQGYDSLEDYLKTTTENAKKNLEKEMKILAIAKENDLWLDDEELGKEILNQATGYTSADDYYADYSKYHAQYVMAKFNIAKEIQKNGKQFEGAG